MIMSTIFMIILLWTMCKSDTTLLAPMENYADDMMVMIRIRMMMMMIRMRKMVMMRIRMMMMMRRSQKVAK